MSRPELLTEENINDELKQIPQWILDGKEIKREYAGPNFAAVVGVVNSIAILAEKAEHHPDLLIYGWNKLRITLSTHDRGGLTENDFNLAKQIEVILP